MTVQQQIVEGRILETAGKLGLTESQGFVAWVQSLLLNKSIHAFDIGDLTDGSEEKQIDCFSVEEDSDTSASVLILQATRSETFESNKLIQLGNGLDWTFRKSRADVDALGNERLKNRILELREAQTRIGAPNVTVKVAFVANGDASALSKEFEDERKAIVGAYSGMGYGRFELMILGARELVDRVYAQERRERRVSAKLRIVYDANKPTLIEYDARGLSGIVCTTSGREVADLVNSDPSDSVFDMNIRRFLGTRGAVNSDILDTCSTPDSGSLFWYLNNGITVVCDTVRVTKDPDNPFVQIDNMQIVNGCQTAKTLALAATDGRLDTNVRVLLRIYETRDSGLVDKVVLTTNNQNRISSRDLRANDTAQVDMERFFARYGYLYERKLRQYDTQKGIDVSRICPNENVGQSYLGIYLKRPSDASRRKYKIWGDVYDRIYSGGVGETRLLALLLHREATKWLRKHTGARSSLKRRIAANGAFHVARVAAQLWLGSLFGRDDAAALKERIGVLEISPTDLAPHFQKALSTMCQLVRAKSEFRDNIDLALKSNVLDGDIDRRMYRGMRATRTRNP